MTEEALWLKTIGRVSFLNCDPLFHHLPNTWSVLPAPPSWLTGHLLRGDCLVAPIPSADYAKYSDELFLLPGMGISAPNEVGSVLLFGNRPVDEMRDIALPSDSSTSQRLLLYLLKQKNLDPRPIEMGPDLHEMLRRCDGALLIGDRALWEAQQHPELVQMDLGSAWYDLTGLPMVFGVLAARKDSPLSALREAYEALITSLGEFASAEGRGRVVKQSSQRSRFDEERIDKYFFEVSNQMREEEVSGLNKFLSDVCGMEEKAQFME